MRADNEMLEIVRGSQNVFRDMGLPNPDVEHLRACLAAEIISILDAEGWSVREAERRTGVAASEFSRIRGAGLNRFTVDRLMKILGRMGRQVDVRVDVSAIPVAA